MCARWQPLTQFDGEKALSLASASNTAAAFTQGELTMTQVTSKLVVLAIHFPTLRILWSKDSTATVALFSALKV